ncbi:MAG TPA: hypothetical protein VG994_19375 [Steroidobacteraceae bacterium]|nr:hypothetical protein [Steroidobacteraceae bacterium]
MATRNRIKRPKAPSSKASRPAPAHRPESASARPEPSTPDADEDERGALLERLSRAIAQAGVCSMALQSLEHKPLIGSIAVSLEVAVQALNETHSDVDLQLQQVTS